MMDEALKTHFLLLRRMMANRDRQIKACEKELTRLVLTYPNYICPEEDDGDFVKYSSHYQEAYAGSMGRRAQLTHGQ